MKSILLVVGAGASHEFDFPLGSDLINLIINNIDYNNNFTPTNGEGRYLDLVNQFFKYIDETPDEIFFKENLISFKNNLTVWREGKCSLDAFLVANDNSHYLGFGKFAIAYYIIGSEEWAIRENLYGFKRNWLRPFLERYLVDNINGILSDKLKLTIITFNYDRIIEHFIYNFLRHWPTIRMSGLDSKGYDKSKEFIDKLDIIHVYEKIADLDWQSKGSKSIRFGERNDDKGHLTVASDRIQLIAQTGTERLSEEKKNKIRKIVQNSHKIYFLGFGFDDDNMKILFGNDIVEPEFQANTSYIATSYMLSEEIKNKYQFIKYYDQKCSSMVEDVNLFSLKD